MRALRIGLLALIVLAPSVASAENLCSSYDRYTALPFDFEFQKIEIVRSRAWTWGDSVSAFANEECLCRTRNPAIHAHDFPDTPPDANFTCRERRPNPVNLFRIY